MDLSRISLATLSLDSSTCADIICGENGLPLTPNSIKIIGDFKALVETVQHPNLTKYVECLRNKNGNYPYSQSREVWKTLDTNHPLNLVQQQFQKELH